MRIIDIITILREYGLSWVTWRLWYEVQLRIGFQRSLPAGEDVTSLLAKAAKIEAEHVDSWITEAWQRQKGKFFFQDAGMRAGIVGNSESVIQDAQRVVAGELRFFSRHERTLGQPPNWLIGANGQNTWPGNVHWSRIPDLSRDLGDIKHVWEPARFGHVFTLARAYAVTSDERYPEVFWTQVESWVDVNKPELGPHWRCGQEMSIRCLSWLFGLYAFQKSLASTPQRVGLLVKQIWYHARHVEKVHWYATKCVRNNHAISEAVGLFSIGTLLPFLPEATHWQRLGIKDLSKEVAWQIYDDGTYIQNSMNYARLVVQLLTWSLSLARLNRIDLPNEVRDRATRLLHFLHSMQDATSGRVPNYGSNDGALIFPLTSCDYLDYRPSLGALSLALGEGRLYPLGPWDEEAGWLVGMDADSQPVSTGSGTMESKAFSLGGFYRLQGEDTHAIIRCASYHHRPTHADMLHLDVWYGGRNVLVDPGTFSYNLDATWAGHFVGTASHNTVVVDGKDQMRRGSRFMWLNWTESKTLQLDNKNGAVVFSGEHYGYRPVVHRRTVVLHENVYLVLDELRGDWTEHTYRLHWLVNDFPLEPERMGATITLPGPDFVSLRLEVLASEESEVHWTRAEERKPRGWQSLYYGERLPAWSMEWVARGRDLRFATLLGPASRVDRILPIARKDIDKLLDSWLT